MKKLVWQLERYFGCINWSSLFEDKKTILPHPKVLSSLLTLNLECTWFTRENPGKWQKQACYPTPRPRCTQQVGNMNKLSLSTTRLVQHSKTQRIWAFQGRCYLISSTLKEFHLYLPSGNHKFLKHWSTGSSTLKSLTKVVKKARMSSLKQKVKD